MSFYGLTSELLLPAGWVFFVGVLIVSRHLPLRWALPVLALKVAIPLFYFAADPGGYLHLQDDLAYFYSVLPLQQMGLNPVSIFTDPRGLPLLMGTAGSRQHIVYHLWNLLGVSVFGPHYFSAVFLNVGLTCASGWFFYRILRGAGFPRDYGRLALAFFLLHWDTVVWSSFLNLKDTLVVTLSLGLLYHVSALNGGGKTWRLIPVAAFFFGLFFLRWYAGVMILAAAFLYLFLWPEGPRRRMHGIIVMAGMFAAFMWTASAVRALAYALQMVRPSDVLSGFPRVLLTPLPWRIEAEYGFLFIPSILHLLVIGPALLAVPLVWSRYKSARVLILYLGMVTLALAITPEFRGIRQRQMIGFVFVWLQFHALWMLAHYAVGTVGSALDPARDPVSGRSGFSAAHGDATAQPQAGQ